LYKENQKEKRFSIFAYNIPLKIHNVKYIISLFLIIKFYQCKQKIIAKKNLTLNVTSAPAKSPSRKTVY